MNLVFDLKFLTTKILLKFYIRIRARHRRLLNDYFILNILVKMTDLKVVTRLSSQNDNINVSRSKPI